MIIDDFQAATRPIFLVQITAFLISQILNKSQFIYPLQGDFFLVKNRIKINAD